MDLFVYDPDRSIWDGPSDDSPSAVNKHRPLDAAIDRLFRKNKKLEEHNSALSRENASLKKLLATHNIAWPANKNLSTIAASDSSTTRSNPELPLEVKLRIIRFALQLAPPIIDPGVKILKSNVTEMEHAEQKKLPVQFLRLSKFFYNDGKRTFFVDNRFIFTQVSSLKWFVSTHPRSCAQLKHLELRIVGKYYDDQGSNKIVTLGFDQRVERWYAVKPIKLWTGLQSYCWRQILDFLNALQLPWHGRQQTRSKEHIIAFKNLSSMMIDLVNFTDNLPGPGIDLRKMTRETLGPIIDNLYIRGQPLERNGSLAYECLGYLMRNGGIRGCSILPHFISTVSSEYLKIFIQDESFLPELKYYANTLPESREEGAIEKYVWKKLPATFGELEGSEVRFHISSGLPVENVEGDYRILLSRRTELNLDEYEGIFGHHDVDLDDDELTNIYGPTRDGWGPDIFTPWDVDEHGGPDTRICANCSGMYGYFNSEPNVRISLERDGHLGAENGFAREIAE
ncbi:uncharacterized protein EAF02_009914 [Botrytis sinoallii]|uniref:uncharacterized protein n=1 Tax=Botrytis sinoallii TaxID=1463999 RepID=UPI001900BB71|nr:uncharacterized protein EAF02_009914 [Botrytis sinoallii]KAF7867128.1 hypothetical protein EAF02_009914 [Botrytis sinoallii]